MNMQTTVQITAHYRGMPEQHVNVVVNANRTVAFIQAYRAMRAAGMRHYGPYVWTRQTSANTYAIEPLDAPKPTAPDHIGMAIFTYPISETR